LLDEFLQKYETIIISIIVIIYITVTTIILCGFIVSIINLYIHDCNHLKKLVRNEHLTRDNIEQQLKVYKTRWGRMEYVNFLWSQNIRPTGNWTINLPNYKDEASSLLARLEEKWLGLDR